MRQVELRDGWRILQDVHDNGEMVGIQEPQFQATIDNTVSEWEPLPRLGHLQTLLAEQPFFGRELRYFNDHAWWYRFDFECPPDAGAVVRLRFEGVDYFAKVWVNGELLGEHEGYCEPFEFGTESAVRRGGPNVLIVKVSSPWDASTLADREAWRVNRNLIKGTYEHSDTFVQRDVNPVGIWQPVKLIVSDNCYPAGRVRVTSTLDADRSHADLAVSWPVSAAQEVNGAEFAVRIEDEATGLTVAQATKPVSLAKGENRLEANVAIKSPRLWSTWDRTGSALYRTHLELRAGGEALLVGAGTFGIRTVAIRRTAEETSLWLNGEKLFIRGTTYFPDTYISLMDRARYERDLRSMIAVGVNAVRVHVHAEKQEFYDLCDRLGILVVQDNELNWRFPTDAGFRLRAERVFAGTIAELKSHPCVAAWICINEGLRKDPEAIRLGEALEQLAIALTRRARRSETRMTPTISPAAMPTTTRDLSAAAHTRMFAAGSINCSASSARTPRRARPIWRKCLGSPASWRSLCPGFPICTMTSTGC